LATLLVTAILLPKTRSLPVFICVCIRISTVPCPFNRILFLFYNMARTRQTARKSTGGKAPRGKGGKGLGKSVDDAADNDDDQLYKNQAFSYLTCSRFSLYNNPYAAGTAANTTLSSSEQPIDTPDTTDPVEYLSNLIDPTFIVENSFYAHYFDCGYTAANESKVFAPRYAVAKSPNPFNPGTTDVSRKILRMLIF
jgi:hypothetical protein